jgi:phage terminase large subunit-like protein
MSSHRPILLKQPYMPDQLLTSESLQLLVSQSLAKVAQHPGINAYKPHDSQRIFHTSPAKEKLYIGGNRSGKTVGGCTEDVMWLTGEHKYRQDLPEPPIRGRMVAVDIEDGIKKIALPEVMKWVPQRLLKNGSFEDSYDRQSRTLTLTNNSFLEFMSYEQEVEKFAGTSRHFCHFDEEPPEDIFNECLMRLVDTNGSYWITMTPLIEMTWVVDRIYEPWTKGDQGIFVLEVNTEENPYINIEALDRLTRGLSAEEQNSRRRGTFLNRTGLVYGPYFSEKFYNEGGNIVPDFVGEDFFKFYDGFEFFECMDHGLKNPAVFLFCAYDQAGNIIVFDEIYETGKSVGQMADLVWSARELLNITPTYTVGDPSIRNRNAITMTSVQTEYMEHGIGIGLGNNNLDAGLTRCINRFLKRKIFISQRCVNTLKEIRNYRWDRYTSAKIAQRRNDKDKPIPRNDHAMDALRYGVMSRPLMEGEEETTVGNIINAPVVGPIDFDYEKMFTNPEQVDSDYEWTW